MLTAREARASARTNRERSDAQERLVTERQRNRRVRQALRLDVPRFMGLLDESVRQAVRRDETAATLRLAQDGVTTQAVADELLRQLETAGYTVGVSALQVAGAPPVHYVVLTVRWPGPAAHREAKP